MTVGILHNAIIYLSELQLNDDKLSPKKDLNILSRKRRWRWNLGRSQYTLTRLSKVRGPNLYHDSGFSFTTTAVFFLLVIETRNKGTSWHQDELTVDKLGKMLSGAPTRFMRERERERERERACINNHKNFDFFSLNYHLITNKTQSWISSSRLITFKLYIYDIIWYNCDFFHSRRFNGCTLSSIYSLKCTNCFRFHQWRNNSATDGLF